MGFLIVAAADHELEDITGAVLGVGSIRAAASAGRALALHTWNGVVLIGTAGVYGLGFGFPPVIVSRRVGWAHAGAQAGLAYVPRSPEPITADPALRAASGLPEADVLTVDAITTDPGIAAAWSQEWEVEHMEAWGVARAAAQAGVPFAAVLAITNRVGPDAHAEWRSNRARAEAAARDAVRRMLTRLTG